MNRTNRALLVTIFCCLSVCTLCATFLLAQYLPRTDGDSQTLRVPSLVGGIYVPDDERLPEALYEVVLDYRSDAASAPGTVLSQYPTPDAERRVFPDRAKCTLRLTVSTGAATYTLPTLIGKSAREAELLLRSHGLRVRSKTVKRRDVAPSLVIDVEPREGSVLSEGETVTLTLSEAPTRQVVRVPHVLGTDVAKANSTLVLRGLVPTEPTYTPSAEPRGTVISQQPISGTLVPSGTRASLTLSDGSLAVKSEYDFEYENENQDLNASEEPSSPCDENEKNGAARK